MNESAADGPDCLHQVVHTAAEATPTNFAVAFQAVGEVVGFQEGTRWCARGVRAAVTQLEELARTEIEQMRERAGEEQAWVYAITMRRVVDSIGALAGQFDTAAKARDTDLGPSLKVARALGAALEGKARVIQEDGPGLAEKVAGAIRGARKGWRSSSKKARPR